MYTLGVWIVSVNILSGRSWTRILCSFEVVYLLGLFCLFLASPVILFFKKIFSIFGCVGSSLLHVGFLWLQRAGAILHWGAQASHCGGLSHCRAWALGAWASVVAARRLSSCGSRALERRLSSCGSWALERRFSSCGAQA